MTTNHDGLEGHPRSRRSRGRATLVATLLLAGVGCDSLLEVDLPGQLTDADLNDPTLAGTLVLSAQSAFECGFTAFQWSTGLWSGDFNSSSNRRTNQIVANRLSTVEVMDVETDCRTKQPPPLYLPLQTARALAEDAVRRIESFPEGSVADEDLLIGTAYAYSGYSVQLLSEAFCQVTIDAGPAMTRAEGYRWAEDRFTRALDHVGRVTAGPSAEEARAIADLAHVGRARARLFLGDTGGVLADAEQVTEGFVHYSTHSATDPYRWNQIHEENNVTYNMTPHASYLNLTVDGVPDPRVPVQRLGFGRAPDGASEVYLQLKMPLRNSPMPFSSWREAQLMIAEVQGGQTAVSIVNTLRDTHDLPHFSATDPATIRSQVLEERRRELWMQGNRLGDMLRLGIPFLTGVNHRNEPYGPETCIPTFLREEISNPNL